MTVQEATERLGIDEQALFERAYKRHGLATSPTGSSTADFSWWKKWGTVPLYVKRLCHELESMDVRRRAMQ